MLITSTQLLTTQEAARRLGVKPATVYAYVSRGLLARDPASGHRRSLFAAAAVERLAGRARRPDSSGALEVVVATPLTARAFAASRMSRRCCGTGRRSRRGSWGRPTWR
jgi:citrate synthase